MESLITGADGEDKEQYDFPHILVSALTGQGITELKEKIAEIGKPLESNKS